MTHLNIYRQTLQNAICSEITQHFIQQEKASCKLEYNNTTALSKSYFSVVQRCKNKQNGNYHKTKAPALRIVVETVSERSKYRKYNWTSPTRSHGRQQMSMASPDRPHNYARSCQKTTTVSSFSAATHHQHRYQKALPQRSHKPHIDYASIL